MNNYDKNKLDLGLGCFPKLKTSPPEQIHTLSYVAQVLDWTQKKMVLIYKM